MTLAARVFEHSFLVYRRTWRGSMFASFISPLLFLSAMGLGLGGLVNRGAGGVGGIRYLDFLAPGLLAAGAMQTAAADASFPTMAKVQWNRTYEAMLATPVGVRDLLAGEIGWLGVRLGTVASIFFAVMLLFGVPRSPLAFLAIPVGVLTGLAFGAPILAFSATQRKSGNFSLLFRFLIMPLFLFGGAFFPVERLPIAIQAVAWVTPLFHGVVLAREFTLGTLAPGPALGHLAVLFAYISIGAVAGYLALRRRLVN